MTALRTARIALLVSIAVILLLGMIESGDPGLLLFVLSPAATTALVVSSIACIVLQIRTAIRARRTRQ